MKIFQPYSFKNDELIFEELHTEKTNENIIFPAEKFSDKLFTLKSILPNNSDILYVVHDEKDQWQFLNGGEVNVDDLTLISIDDLISFDPTIAKILNLRKGSEAKRKSTNSEWIII